MASKFVLTAALKLQAPSAAELDKVRVAITKSLGNFKIPLKIAISRNIAKNVLADLDKLDKKLFQVAGSFGVFARQAKRAFNQILSISTITTALNNLMKNMTAAVGTINTMSNSVTRLTSKTTATQLSLAGFQQALKSIASNGSSIKSTVNGIGDSIEQMGFSAAQSIKRFGTFTLITSSFLSLIHAIRSSVGEAVAFEAEVIKLRQITGQSTTGIKELTGEIDRLSTGLGVSSKELLDVTVTLAQAGLTAKQTKTALEAIAKASLSPSFDDMNSIVEGSIAIFQQFGVKAEGLESVLGSMSAVAAKFAVESSDLNTAIRRTGGAFQAAGGDINQLFALFTSVRQTTRESAESIATGFRTIFARLQRNRTQDFLKQFGVNLRFSTEEAKKFGKTANTFVGPYEAIRRLSEALNGLNAADPRFAQIIEELGGFRQISKVIPLIKQNAVAQQAYQVALEGTNSLEEDAALAQESLANRLTKVREEFQLLIRNISNNSGFQQMIDSVLGLAKSFIKLADSVRPIIPALLGLGALQLAKNTGEYLAGATRGFGSIGGDSSGKPKGFMNTALATGASNPHLLALTIVSGSLVRSFTKLDQTTQLVVGGLTNVVSQFAIFREIISSIGPFSGPKTNLLSAQSKMQGLKDKYVELTGIAPYLGSKGLKNANLASQNSTLNEIRTLAPQIKGLEKQASQMFYLASGIAAVVAISTVLADTFDTIAEAELKIIRSTGGSGSRAKFKNASQTSGAASGVGTGFGIGVAAGATIGSVIPGAGTVVGGAVGGIIGALSGGAMGWISAGVKAQNILDQIDFNNRFANVKSTLDEVTGPNPTKSARNGISDVRTGLGDLQQQLRTVSNSDRRADLLSEGKAITTNLNAFFQNLAGSTNSLEEFKSVVGDDTLNMFSFLSNKSLPEFLAQINETINSEKQRKKINEDSIKIQLDYNETIKSQLLFANAIDEAKLSVLDFAASINSVLGFASGGAGGAAAFQFGAIDQIKSGNNVNNIDKFERDLNILGKSFGSFGKEQSDRALAAAKVSRELPSILLDLAGSSPLDDSGNISDRLEARLNDKFGSQIPTQLLDAIVGKSEELRGADKKDTKLLESFQSDPQGTISQFTKVLENQADGLADSGSKLQDAFNTYGQTVYEIIKLNQNYVSELGTVLNLIDQRNRFLSDSFNTKQDFNSFRATDLQRQANITGDAGLINNPAAVAQALSASQQEVQFREGNLQSEAFSLDERKREVELLTNAQFEVSRLNDALKFMADASNRAAADVEELGVAQSSRKAKLGVFTQFLGADNAGRRDIRRNIVAADNAVQNGNLDGVRQDQRSQVLSLIEGINPEKFKEILANEAKNLGIDPKGLITPDDKEKVLIEEVAKKYEIAIQAQEAYTKAIGENTTKYIEEQDKLFRNFLDEFKKIFISGIQDQLNSDIQGKDAQSNILGAQNSAFEKLSQITGTNNVSGIRRLLDVQSKIEATGSTTAGLDAELEFQKNGRFNAFNLPFGLNGNRAILSHQSIQEEIGALTSDQLGINEDKAAKLRNNIQNRLGEAFVPGSNGFRGMTFQGISTEEIEKLRNEIKNDIASNEIERLNAVRGLDPGAAQNVMQNRGTIDDLLKQLPKDFNVNENTKQLQTLNVQIQELNRRLGNPPGMASGGFIPGTGNRDNTLINTTPGEFVVRKSVAQRHGPMLAMLNKTGRLPHFANGGMVGGGDGGGMSSLNSAITTFGLNINKMVEALSMFPREISMQATHTVNVVHTGAQVFSSLEPALVSLVEGKVSQALNNLTSKYMDIGHISNTDLFQG